MECEAKFEQKEKSKERTHPLQKSESQRMGHPATVNKIIDQVIRMAVEICSNGKRSQKKEPTLCKNKTDPVETTGMQKAHKRGHPDSLPHSFFGGSDSSAPGQHVGQSHPSQAARGKNHGSRKPEYRAISNVMVLKVMGRW